MALLLKQAAKQAIQMFIPVITNEITKIINNQLTDITNEIITKMDIILNNKELIIEEIKKLNQNDLSKLTTIDNNNLKSYEKIFILNNRNKSSMTMPSMTSPTKIREFINTQFSNPKIPDDFTATSEEKESLPNLENLEKIIYNLLNKIYEILIKKDFTNINIDALLFDMIGIFSNKIISDTEKESINECIEKTLSVSGRDPNPLSFITKLQTFTNPEELFKNCEEFKKLNININTVRYIINVLIYKISLLININDSSKIENIIKENPSIFLFIKEREELMKKLKEEKNNEKIKKYIKNNIEKYKNKFIMFIKTSLDKIISKIIKNKYELIDDTELMYYEKYIKYKSKYLELKNQLN